MIACISDCISFSGFSLGGLHNRLSLELDLLRITSNYGNVVIDSKKKQAGQGSNSASSHVAPCLAPVLMEQMSSALIMRSVSMNSPSTFYFLVCFNFKRPPFQHFFGIGTGDDEN
eukprot:jgi/Chrzof1/3083/Cz12g11040.t1